MAAATVPVWIPDETSRRCTGCRAAFSFLNRRHHCRSCGQLFCANCTPLREGISSDWEPAPNVASPDTGIVVGAFKWALGRSTSATAKRCCEACVVKLGERRAAHPIAEAILLAGDTGHVDIVEWRALVCLNRRWKDAMATILSVWYDAQQMRPYSRLTTAHKRLLRINARRMHGHVAWSVLAASCDIPVPMDAKLHVDKWSVPCATLGCQIKCSGIASCLVDGMLFLCGDMTAAQRILRASTLVPLMALSNTLASYCARHPEAFEALVIPMVSSPAAGASELAHALFFGVHARDRLLAGGALLRVPADVLDEWRRTLMLITRLQMLLGGRGCVEERDWKGALLPHDPTVRVVGIMEDAISVKGSSTRPMIVPCMCAAHGGREFVRCFLLKRESVFADAMVQEIIRFMRELSAGPNAAIPDHVVYGVQPLDGDTGMISMHPGCRSLYSLWNDRISIQNFVLEHNQFDSVHTLRQRFSGSCAVTVVLALLIGAGDRHLDNLLVTRKGHLFGVDFSFLFNDEPNLAKRVLGNEIRITRSMTEMLGGMHSVQYSNFKAQCSDLFERFRRFHALFYFLMRALVMDGYISEEKLIFKIETTWLPSATDSQARFIIENRIDRESRGESYFFDAVTDYFHHMFRSKE